MINDLESNAASKTALTRADAERVMASADLVAIGLLGEMARRAHHGDRVTFGQVIVVTEGVPTDLGEAREVRLSGRPESIEEAASWVAAVARTAGTVPVTGFSAHGLLELVGGDHIALAEAAERLHANGLSAVAAFALDRVDDGAEAICALARGGLGVWRAVIERAPALTTRLDLIERASHLQAETGVFRALAPLPVLDDAETPSTGYDDVKTIALARLVCPAIASIQVDWALYGPKLAQVAIAYGADDIDNVPAVDSLALGRRRSPREDIERHIAAAFAGAAARDGRFELVP